MKSVVTVAMLLRKIVDSGLPIVGISVHGDGVISKITDYRPMDREGALSRKYLGSTVREYSDVYFSLTGFHYLEVLYIAGPLISTGRGIHVYARVR